MVICSFCGFSNDAKCVQKRRIYPNQPKDANGERTESGPICKLCDRKFFAHDKVDVVLKMIQASKISLVQGIKRLESQGNEAKA